MRIISKRTIPNPLRRVLMWTVQAGIIAASLFAALLLRFDFRIPAEYYSRLIFAIALWIVVKTVCFRILQLDRGWWGFVSSADLAWIGAANLLASGVCYASLLLFRRPEMPRSIYVLDPMICFLLIAAARYAIVLLGEARVGAAHKSVKKKDTLIYGAGEAGLMLVREIRRNPNLPYRVRGFIDDQPEKTGLRLSGVRVLGTGDSAIEVIHRRAVEVVLVAIPSATGTQMTRILEVCHEAGVECRTVPGLGQMIAGESLSRQIREVAVEDLLGRTPVVLDEDHIREVIQGRVILVTGAGGSIGSELCRQVARFGPAGIIGFDSAESALFEVDNEIKANFPEINFHPEIGTIQNRARLDALFSRYMPHAVFHAAAYKHVPLMEAHVFEAVENNVFGTYNVAMAAADYGVDDFVLISTDKAVSPTSVMGATKRLAELMMLGLQKSRVKFVAVRFGNVLGSNGSVIPTFKKQIAKGGPVTVTHPEMKRFFMTIPEACQLVLQASAIAKGGQICVLDMDKPVKIDDLARKLILLSGLRPDQDIRIEYSGIRPGEKLVEELTSSMEDTIPSSHKKIRVFVSSPEHRTVDIFAYLDRLRQISEARDIGSLVLVMKELIPDFNPSAGLLRETLEHLSASNARANRETGRFGPPAKSARLTATTASMD